MFSNLFLDDFLSFLSSPPILSSTLIFFISLLAIPLFVALFFEQLNIVGWYVSVPYRVSEDMNGIRKIHLDNFAGNDKVCFVKDRAENEEGFYSYEQSGLGKQQGYYIPLLS